ncbi:hypothetical protein IBB73_03680 [Listeria seeligeri]|uniref:hypothetical protein n=1 Tax=Listeria seeligeri TaxID=1640 RepID=UPI001A0FE325|nr:hypothetical protein [Listeria seeligeri]MBF2654880.1 hypothetical protein [Listeria seeligeri]
MMALEDKVVSYENKKEQLLAEMSNVSNAIHGALNGNGQQNSLRIAGLTSDITEIHKKRTNSKKIFRF